MARQNVTVSGGVVATTTPTTAAAQGVQTPAATTTTTAPVYVPPHIATETIPGTSGPAAQIVSSSWPVTTSGGAVSATATWSGGDDLTLSVSCAGAATGTQTGPTGLTAETVCNAGQATVAIEESASDPTNVSYNIVISYPST